MKSFHRTSMFFAIIMSLFFCSALFAQMENFQGVRLKDGNVAYGKIMEMNAEKGVLLKKDHVALTRKSADVDSFLKVGEKTSQESLLNKVHTWEIWPEISFIEYKEPDVMREKGAMYGIGASYTYRNEIMAKVEGRYSYGRVDYQNSGTINNIDDIIFELRGLGGYDVKLSSTFTVTPFIGFGYRYLRDDMSGRVSSTGHLGYLRESNYFYSPMGIEAVNAFENGWSVGVTMEYDYFWKGRQKSYLSTTNASYSDITNDQNSGYGLRGSVSVKKRSGGLYYSLEPFIRYWNIDQSEYQYMASKNWYEPKNNSTEIGVKFGVGF